MRIALDIFTLEKCQRKFAARSLENIDGFGEVCVSRSSNACDQRTARYRAAPFHLCAGHPPYRGKRPHKLLARSYGTYGAFEAAMKEAAPLAGDAWNDLNQYRGHRRGRRPRRGRILQGTAQCRGDLEASRRGAPPRRRNSRSHQAAALLPERLWCFTGSLEKFTRDEAKARPKASAQGLGLGFERRRTSWWLAPAPARKLDKAREFGVEVADRGRVARLDQRMTSPVAQSGRGLAAMGAFLSTARPPTFYRRGW